MRLSGLLSRAQAEDIHRSALRVLSEVGVRVDHESICERLAAVGGSTDSLSGRVRFAPEAVEHAIQTAPRTADLPAFPRVHAGANVYQCVYLDPFSNTLRPFDEDLMARYFGMAASLPLIESIGLLGLPFVPDDMPAQFIPLAEKLYAWKHGAFPGGSVHQTSLCEPLLDMYRIHADATGRQVGEIFAACGFLISPLKLGRPECEQMLFFADNGLHMGIGHMPSQGGTAPVTFAGCLSLALAEQLFIFLLNRSFRPDSPFTLGSMVTTIDMRTGGSCYGRPERHRLNMAFADMADFYGCECAGHTGCSDAKAPSCEAGVEKAYGVLATALSCGSAYIEAGLLGVDMICSPVQMVLDHDIAGCLQALLAEPCVDPEQLAFDEIAANLNGPGHMATEFTVTHHRRSLFEPATWTRPPGAWLGPEKGMDVEKALDTVADFEKTFVPSSHISEEEERALRAVIRRAAEREHVSL